MKKMKKNQVLWQVLSCMLCVFALLSGGGAMAVGTVENPDVDNMMKADPAADHDPVDKDVNDRQSPGGEHDGQDLTGTQATAT